MNSNHADNTHSRRRDRGAAAQDLIEKSGYAAAALTLIPLPGSEIVAVMPIHVGMVVGVGAIYGQSVTKKAATDIVVQICTTVGMSLVGSRIATTAAKVLLPGLGGFVAAPFMFASTLAIGAVARAYFESGCAMSDADMRSVYERAQRSARSSFDASRMRSEEARDAAEAAATQDEAEEPSDRLEKLRRLLDDGLIDQSEYDETKARVLSEL